MAKRPRVFERDVVEAQFRKQGLPETLIAPTISFMRLMVPLTIRSVGVEGMVDLIESASVEWGVEKQSPGWSQSMASALAEWAENVIKDYREDRFGDGVDEATI